MKLRNKILAIVAPAATIAAIAPIALTSCNNGAQGNTITYTGSKSITMTASEITIQFTLANELSTGQSLQAGASELSGTLPVTAQTVVAVSGKTATVTLTVYPQTSKGTSTLNIHFTCKKDSLPVWEQTITGFTVTKNA